MARRYKQSKPADGVEKNRQLLRNVVISWHPKFRDSDGSFILDRIWVAEDWPEAENVLHMVEPAMAYASGGAYQYTPDNGFDFSDKSDCKTATIREKSNALSKNCYSGSICGIKSAAGTLKRGALRVVVYNPHARIPQYWFFPTQIVKQLKLSTGGSFSFQWNKVTNSIPRFEAVGAVRCATFEELAKCTDKGEKI